jgi:hypothetical protein
MMNHDHEIDRVRRNTSPGLLERIDRMTESNIRFFSTQPASDINARLRELDQEWSIERFLQLNSSVLALGGAFLGVTSSRKWFLLSATIMGFLFQHAVQGWCPPLPILRRLGIRTRGEIDREKFALKAARGDFDAVKETSAHQMAGGAPSGATAL